MTHPVRPEGRERKRLVAEARSELTAALAIIEDADAEPVLACPHLCAAWELWLRARGCARVEGEELVAAVVAAEPSGLSPDERARLPGLLASAARAARDQQHVVELEAMELSALREHARLLHHALGY